MGLTVQSGAASDSFSFEHGDLLLPGCPLLGFVVGSLGQGFPGALKVAERRARHSRPPLCSAESSSPLQPSTPSSGRACVALDCVPLPGNSVWGPKVKLRHVCPASLVATCLILSQQLHPWWAWTWLPSWAPFPAPALEDVRTDGRQAPQDPSLIPCVPDGSPALTLSRFSLCRFLGGCV